LLAQPDGAQTLRHLAVLWGYEVRMEEVDSDTDSVLATHSASPPDKP
jgi:spore cortex formation protein SpoVR/YcgB (stage V sporulation)